MVCNAEGNNENFVFDKIYMTFYQRCIFSEIRNEVVKAFPDIRGTAIFDNKGGNFKSPYEKNMSVNDQME